MRTVSMSPEVAKELIKYRTIEDLLQRILPVCKNEKDIKMMKHYLSMFASFVVGVSASEEGRGVLLKLKELYELILFILDTISLSSLGGDNTSLVSLVQYSLMFLRNSALSRSNKPHFLSTP
jgi:hypothetical protein